MLSASLFVASVDASSCFIRSPVADFDAVVIVDYFREPACEWCTGNRGIELRLESGQPIFAVADGVVSFGGEVNRTKYLVLLTDTKRRVSYGKIASSRVRAGDRVVAGQTIAVSGPSLYFGIREVSEGKVRYRDPMKFLANLTTRYTRAVLVSGSLDQRNLQNLQC